MLLPINEYQRKLYEKIKEIGYKVFDEVPADEELPLVTISDYTLEEGSTKNDDYIFTQKIDIYSLYEGKKQVNEMASNVIAKVKEVANTDLNKNYFIDYVKLDESNVARLEDGLYVASLSFKINIGEVE